MNAQCKQQQQQYPTATIDTHPARLHDDGNKPFFLFHKQNENDDWFS